MAFRLYTSKTTHDSGLSGPFNDIIGLFGKMTGEVKGDFIGEFPSHTVVYQFINDEISKQGGEIITINPPNIHDWISVDFKTSDGEEKSTGYFISEID